MTPTHFTPVPLDKSYRLMNHGPTVLVSARHGDVINVMAAWFLMDRGWSRAALAVINSAAFISIRLYQFHDYSGTHVPFNRYVVTTILVVFTASVVSEYIRKLDASYRQTLEAAGMLLSSEEAAGPAAAVDAAVTAAPGFGP